MDFDGKQKFVEFFHNAIIFDEKIALTLIQDLLNAKFDIKSLFPKKRARRLRLK